MSKQHPTIFGGSLEWHTDPKDFPTPGKRIIVLVAFDDKSGFFINSELAILNDANTPFGLGTGWLCIAWSYYDASVAANILENYNNSGR